MTPFRLLAAILLAGPASAQSLDQLDQCLADPAQTQAVFTERFPHETCDIATTCVPILVQSAATLARERCRRSAMERCTGDVSCINAFTVRWAARATELSSILQVRWQKADPTRFSELVTRRLGAPDAFHNMTGCTGKMTCAHEALQNLTRMERLDTYFQNQEARQ